MVGKEDEAACIVFATRHSERRKTEKYRYAALCLATLLLFGQFEAPAQEMVLLTLRMALPTSLN